MNTRNNSASNKSPDSSPSGVPAESPPRSGEERFELAMLAVNDGLWDWDIAADKVFFDDRYYSLAGYEPGDFPQDFAEWIKRVHLQDIDKCQAAVKAHLEGRTRVFDIQFRFRKKDGTWMWIRGRGKSVANDADGKVIRMIGTHTDITAQKEAEAQLEALNETLEERIRERTLELDGLNRDLTKANAELSETLSALHGTQDTLLRSEKLAALGQLAAGIAHELNTPLGAIVSSNRSISGLVVDRFGDAARTLAGLPAELREWFAASLETRLAACRAPGEPDDGYRRRKRLEAAFSSQGRAPSERLVESMLDLRLEDDTQVIALALRYPEFEPALEALNTFVAIKDMSDVIGMAADKSAHVVSALLYYVRQEDDQGMGQVEIAKELDSLIALYATEFRSDVVLVKDFESRGFVLGDGTKLNQVWMNLIQNALQAMEHKGTLRLSVDDEDPWVRVSIGDSGPGIPEHLRKRIFEPFFTTKKDGGGTGIGLDICRKIVDRHKGRIEFESAPGSTVFRVFLPAFGAGGGAERSSDPDLSPGDGNQ